MKQWAVVDTDEDGVHIVPVDDAYVHITTMKCVCGPIAQNEVIVHEPLDERN